MSESAKNKLLDICKANELIQLQKLISDNKGLDLNAYIEKLTPLAACILGESYECLKFLLESGADPNLEIQTNSGIFPLGFTVSKGYSEMSKLLIENGADKNQKIKVREVDSEGEPTFLNMSVLGIAVQKDADLFNELVSEFDINELDENGGSLLGLAVVSRSNISDKHLVIKKLLSLNSRLDQKSKEKFNRSENVMLNAFPSYEDFSDEQSLAEREKIIEEFIERGCGVEGSLPAGNNLVKQSTQMGSPKLVKKFLDLGIDPDEPDKAGFTALMNACTLEDQGRSEEIIDLLLEQNINVNFQSKNGATACALSINHNNYSALVKLAKKGADFPAFARGRKNISEEKTGTPIPLWMELFTQIRSQEDINNISDLIDFGLDLTPYEGKDTVGRNIKLTPYGVLCCRQLIISELKEKGGTWEIDAPENLSRGLPEWVEHKVSIPIFNFSELLSKLNTDFEEKDCLIKIDSLSITHADLNDLGS